MKEYLNLGCGHRFNSEWTNINFISTDAGVIAYNLLQGIPFPDETFRLVYCSHLLEHLPQEKARPFIQECLRVLQPEGVVRLVVPDLQNIVKTYLKILADFESGNRSPSLDADYHWILLEMYDQTVRNEPGGMMKKYLFGKDIVNESFVVSRCGSEARNLINAGRNRQRSDSPPENGMIRWIKNIYHYVSNAKSRRDVVMRKILGDDYRAYAIGRFRLSGEIHQWMYDHYSLRILLENAGFIDIKQRNAAESYIQDWSGFNLDTEPDGSIYKPDSIYMEGMKRP